MYKQFSEALQTVARKWEPNTLQTVCGGDQHQLKKNRAYIYEMMATVALERVSSVTDHDRVRQLCSSMGVTHGNKVISRYIGSVAETAAQAGADRNAVLEFLKSSAGFRILGEIASLPQSIAGEAEYALSLIEPTYRLENRLYLSEIYVWGGNEVITPMSDELSDLAASYSNLKNGSVVLGCPVQRAKLLENVYQSYVTIAETDNSVVLAAFADNHDTTA